MVFAKSNWIKCGIGFDYCYDGILLIDNLYN